MTVMRKRSQSVSFGVYAGTMHELSDRPPIVRISDFWSMFRSNICCGSICITAEYFQYVWCYLNILQVDICVCAQFTRLCSKTISGLCFVCSPRLFSTLFLTCWFPPGAGDIATLPVGRPTDRTACFRVGVDQFVFRVLQFNMFYSSASHKRF